MDVESRHERLFELRTKATGFRPRMIMDKEDLVFLRLKGFTLEKIANFYGCHLETIKNRCKEYGIW